MCYYISMQVSVCVCTRVGICAKLESASVNLPKHRDQAVPNNLFWFPPHRPTTVLLVVRSTARSEHQKGDSPTRTLGLEMDAAHLFEWPKRRLVPPLVPGRAHMVLVHPAFLLQPLSLLNGETTSLPKSTADDKQQHPLSSRQRKRTRHHHHWHPYPHRVSPSASGSRKTPSNPAVRRDSAQGNGRASTGCVTGPVTLFREPAKSNATQFLSFRSAEAADCVCVSCHFRQEDLWEAYAFHACARQLYHVDLATADQACVSCPRCLTRRDHIITSRAYSILALDENTACRALLCALAS